MKRILCFGDSLTWGWIPQPDGVPSERYAYHERWTGVLAGELGAGFEIIEEGLSGRTTAVDDPVDPRLNGRAYLPATLASHLPLDLVIIMLGTNDTKVWFNRSPFEIAGGIQALLREVALSAGGVGTLYPAPQTLVMCPPPLAERPTPWFDALFDGGPEKTRALPDLYRACAEFNGAHFFDAGSVISTGGVDGIHFSADNNLDLGRALAPVVRQILG